MAGKKEGLESALDFTKYLLAIAGGIIAFVLSSDVLARVEDITERGLLTAALVLLCLSVLGGIAVLSRGAIMLSEGEYSLEDKYLKWPGLANIFAFGGGFICVALFIGIVLWNPPPAPPGASVVAHQYGR
jgi:hypothetical protein